jgi:hypothetical protein
MEVPQLIAGPDFGYAEEISELVPRPEWALPTSQETKLINRFKSHI